MSYDGKSGDALCVPLLPPHDLVHTIPPAIDIICGPTTAIVRLR